ncbi:hypothetical protein TNCV_904681 [Trichonephila clavipes]|nr:hypothetical protein TNCV_904681 [Trichonephila clavipes]
MQDVSQQSLYNVDFKTMWILKQVPYTSNIKSAIPYGHLRVSEGGTNSSRKLDAFVMTKVNVSAEKAELVDIQILNNCKLLHKLHPLPQSRPKVWMTKTDDYPTRVHKFLLSRQVTCPNCKCRGGACASTICATDIMYQRTLWIRTVVIYPCDH